MSITKGAVRLVLHEALDFSQLRPALLGFRIFVEVYRVGGEAFEFHAVPVASRLQSEHQRYFEATVLYRPVGPVVGFRE